MNTLEELFKEMRIEMFAMLTAMFFGIRDVISFVYNSGLNVLESHLKNRNKIKEVKTDLEIRKIKKEHERQMEYEDILYNQKIQGSFLANLNEIHSKIKEIREFANCRNVIISVFHNGVHKGFRHYSRKFEEPREIKYSTAVNYQSKPLSEYYKTLQLFEKQDYIHYNINQTTDSIYAKRISVMEEEGLEHVLVLPLLVSSDEEIPSEFKIMPIDKNMRRYYMIASLIIYLDDESDSSKISALIHIAQNRIYDILNMFLKNNKILG